jgi:hypothetical protein
MVLLFVSSKNNSTYGTSDAAGSAVHSIKNPLFDGGRSMSAPPPTSDIQLLRERKGIVNFDTKVSYCALNLAVA